MRKIDKKEKRVLVIDDEPAILEILKDGLEEDGFTVEVVDSAEEGLNILKAFDPHVVITDNDMPQMKGIDLLRALRKQENYVNLLFISGRTDVHFVSEALKQGADDYIRKPFRIEELLARVEATLRHNESHRELVVANNKLKELVEHDYLTGLFNMRSMYERIDLEIKRSIRYDRKMAVVMLDMDHFKSVNDDHDHLFGSFVIKEMGRLIKETMRDTDFAARYGGDEFLVVLLEADEIGAERFCQRLRERVEAHEFDDGRDQISLTISLGFSVFSPESDRDARQIVRLADEALYQSKEKGRNCITQV